MNLKPLAIAIAVTAVAAASLVATPASASDARLKTETVLRVLPGGHRAEFHNGDPIKICYLSKTNVRTDATVVVAIDQREARPGTHWSNVGTGRVFPNKMGCFTTHIRVDGPNDPDLKLRARTTRTPGVERSTSSVITLNVGAARS